MSVDKPNMLSMDFSKDYASMVFKRLLLKPYRGHCYHQNLLVLGTNYVAGDVHLQLEL